MEKHTLSQPPHVTEKMPKIWKQTRDRNLWTLEGRELKRAESQDGVGVEKEKKTDEEKKRRERGWRGRRKEGGKGRTGEKKKL